MNDTTIYAVRIKAHGPDMNEIAAPHWPIGKYLRFRPAPADTFGPSFDSYEAVNLKDATFGSRFEAKAIMGLMRQYPFVICEIRQFVDNGKVI